jgi:hypothetical protein
MYMIEKTAALTYVHDRGDNIPTYVHDRGDNTATHMYMIEETTPQHMYMIEEITALTYMLGLLSPLSCTYVRDIVSSIMYIC